MKKRGPFLSASAPKRVDSRNISTVTGMLELPASSALNPATCCRNSTRKKNVRPRPPYIRNVSRLPAAKLRRLNSSSGSIGRFAHLPSHSRNETNMAAPSASGSATVALVQPCSGCSISPNVIPARPNAQSRAPTTSTRAFGSRSRPAGTTRRIRISVTTTTGTLMAKIQRQEAASTSWPPTTGPSTVPIPPHAVQVPTALPRSSCGKVETITASAAGVSSAPATPCSARAATSTSIVGASAHSSEVAPNAVTPSAKTRRSPKMSPSDPPISSSEESVTR